jgi:hypothetical protein
MLFLACFKLLEIFALLDFKSPKRRFSEHKINVAQLPISELID